MVKRCKHVKKRSQPRKHVFTRSPTERLSSEKGPFSDKIACIGAIAKNKRMSRWQKLRARRAIMEDRPIGRLGRPRLLSALHERMLSEEVIKSMQSERLLRAPDLAKQVCDC